MIENAHATISKGNMMAIENQPAKRIVRFLIAVFAYILLSIGVGLIVPASASFIILGLAWEFIHTIMFGGGGSLIFAAVLLLSSLTNNFSKPLH